MGARKCCLEVGIHQHHGVYRQKSMRETVVRQASCQFSEAPKFCSVKILSSKRGSIINAYGPSTESDHILLELEILALIFTTMDLF